MYQMGKVANPSRGQLNRENEYFPCPRSRLRIWSREAVQPSRPASARSFSTLRLNHQSSIINHQSSIIYLVLTHGILPDFRGGVYLFIYTAIRHQASLEFIGSRTGLVVPKVVPITGAVFASSWTN